VGAEAAEAARGTILRHRLLLSTLSNYVGKFTALGFAFLLTPFLVHQLGPAAFGLWVLVDSVMGYGSLLDFGIADAIIKYVAEYRAKGQIDQAHGLVATALWLYSALGLVAFGLSVALAPVFPLLFNVPPEDRTTATSLVALTGLLLGISIPSASTTAALRGLQRYDVANSLAVAGTLISGGATVTVVLLGGGLLGMAAIGIPITLLMQVVTVWCIRRIAPELRFGWRGARRALVKTVFAFSASLSVMHLAGRIQTKTDEVVIGAFLPLSAVTPYALADRLSQVPQILTDQFMKVLAPLASELHAENDLARLRALYIVGSRLTLAIFLPIACTFVVLAGPILTAWVGADYANSAPIVVILVLASLIETSQWPAMALLQGIARHQPLARMWAAAAVANLGLSIALVHSFLGVTGVAIGTLIPTTAVCFGFVLPYAMRTLGVSMQQVVAEVVWPAVQPAIPSVALLWVLRQLLQPTPIVTILLMSMVMLCVYATLYLTMSATGLERRMVRDVTLSITRTFRTLTLHP